MSLLKLVCKVLSADVVLLVAPLLPVAPLVLVLPAKLVAPVVPVVAAALVVEPVDPPVRDAIRLCTSANNPLLELERGQVLDTAFDESEPDPQLEPPDVLLVVPLVVPLDEPPDELPSDCSLRAAIRF